MFENVSEHLDEAVRLAERCPEKYKVPCFEALIRVLAEPDSLQRQNGSGSGLPLDRSSGTPSFTMNGFHKPPDSTVSQQQSHRGPIFLDQYQIPNLSISRVYHLNGDSYRIIVKDLDERTISKKQVKLALLLGVGELLTVDSPVFSKDRLIEACREYGAYDAPNFASHMKKQRDMFIAQGNGWSLTVPGQQRAAEAIKELAS
tara:strand:- start:197 stop:802 length:606 start_codon:yes stop_codon:yes gene_type:complete